MEEEHICPYCYGTGELFTNCYNYTTDSHGSKKAIPVFDICIHCGGEGTIIKEN